RPAARVDAGTGGARSRERVDDKMTEIDAPQRPVDRDGAEITVARLKMQKPQALRRAGDVQHGWIVEADGKRVERNRQTAAECLHDSLLARPAGEERDATALGRYGGERGPLGRREVRLRERVRVRNLADRLDVDAEPRLLPDDGDHRKLARMRK